MPASYRVTVLGYLATVFVGGLIALAVLDVAAHTHSAIITGSPVTFPSRIMARQLLVDHNVTPMAEERDDEMFSSDSPELASANINTTELKAMEGEYCRGNKGCDKAFICVANKCIKGCTKRSDCPILQACKDGKCLFQGRECSNYETPCISHEYCCSGYCDPSGTFSKPGPNVCKRFHLPKPQVPQQPSDPKDPTKPTEPKKPKESEKPKKPKESGKPKKPKNPKKPKCKKPRCKNPNKLDEIEDNDVAANVEDVEDSIGNVEENVVGETEDVTEVAE